MTSYQEWQRKHRAEVDLNYRAFAEQREQSGAIMPAYGSAFAFGRVIAAGPDEGDVAAALEALDPTADCRLRVPRKG